MLEVMLYALEMLEGMCGVLEAVDGELCLAAAVGVGVVEVVGVIGWVVVGVLEAVEGGLCLLEVMEVMRRVILCMLEVVEVMRRVILYAGGVGGAGVTGGDGGVGGAGDAGGAWR